MSAILTEDMPKNCAECPFLHDGEYGALEKSWCSLDSTLCISEKKRPGGCKVKSVEGLIEKMKAKQGFMIGSAPFRVSDAYDEAINDAIKIIKEYCEMEDK